MVAIAGYENFVSRIDFRDDLERPEWMGKVDFAGLKLKVISALVAISSIELLKVFLNSGSYEEGEILDLIVKIMFYMLQIILTKCIIMQSYLLKKD